MKRAITLLAFIPFLSLFLLSEASAKELKIGYINSERILNESQDYKDAKKILEEEEKKYSKQARDMELDIQNLEDEIEAQSLMWSEEKKIEKQQEAQNLYLKYQQFLQEIWGQTGKLYQRNLELSKPIVDKINDVITRIGEAEGYDMIFDGAAGNLVFAKPEFDLTDRVIEELGKK
jgi:outer membrane protein